MYKIVLLMLLLAPSTSLGQIVMVRSTSSTEEYRGTGFVVAKGGGQTYVMSACHVIHGGSDIFVLDEGVQYSAEISLDNWPYDVVVLVVKQTLSSPEIKLAEAVYKDRPITYEGYAGGITMTKISGKVMDVRNKWFYGSGKPRDGMSGGPILCGGELVGVISARIEETNQGTGPSLSVIRPLVLKAKEECSN